MTRRTFIGTGAAVTGAMTLAAAGPDAAAAQTPLDVRFGLNLLVYTAAFGKDQVDLIRKVADFGYDGVEIPFNDLDLLDAEATRKAREAANVGLTACAVLMPGMDLVSADAAERKAGVAHLKRCADITAAMGGNAVAGPLYAPVGKLTGRARTEDEWKRGVEGLRAAAEHAATVDILLAIEPLNRFETYFINTAHDAVQMAEEVDHPNLKVQIDTFHANIEEKSVGAAVRHAAPYLKHLHACENDRGIPGSGHVAWTEFFDAVAAIGYDGWMTIESFGFSLGEMSAAAAIWRDLAPTPEAIPFEGVKFL
ncbi:MAG: Sugar phosphate isomerase/epimerase, partial [Candidatus Hydrogenedentes bacterium]|nr:Sugar phosphate isomerase/epimerase [Candidatus Hydrogenedentota bacterium]